MGVKNSQRDMCSCIIICTSLTRLLIINPLNHWKSMCHLCLQAFQRVASFLKLTIDSLVLAWNCHGKGLSQVIITLNHLLCVVIPHLKAIRMLPVLQDSRGSRSERLPFKFIVIISPRHTKQTPERQLKHRAIFSTLNVLFD